MEKKITVKEVLESLEKSKKGYWLMKSEPDAYSIDDLKKEKKCHWDGIRNYQARNFMMKHMRIGDEVLFYHSNTQPPGVVGIAKIVGPVIEDYTAKDKKSKYYDPKHTAEKPRWFMTEVGFVKKFRDIISLEDIRNTVQLQDMLVIQKGQRLSIQPILKKHFDHIVKLAQ